MKKKPTKNEKKPGDFGGFKPLEGLKQFKERLVAEEKKADEAKRKPAQAPPPPAPARPASIPKRPAPDAAEDDLAFHRLMAGVTPFDKTKGARVPVEGRNASGTPRPPPEEIRAKARAEATEVIDHLNQLVDSRVRFEVTDDGARVEGRRVDAPPALLRSLRHGRLPIDGRLDLHGLSPAEARERTLEFLRKMRANGERCVLVIHGKGEGVLRGEVAAWLSQGKAREHIAAFATAPSSEGGEGAMLVALRR